MIPTLHKAKLANTLSWPLGAEAISAGLAGVPHAADFTLYFANSPVWPASAFQRILRERRPYAVLVARYQPARRPGYMGSTAMFEAGWDDAKWQLQVNPVPRPLRSTVGALLREQGLPAVADWLRGSTRPGWEGRGHCLELVFAPAEGTLARQTSEGV
jgi:hypothetical protein